MGSSKKTNQWELKDKTEEGLHRIEIELRGIREEIKDMKREEKESKGAFYILDSIREFRKQDQGPLQKFRKTLKEFFPILKDK